MSAGTSTFGHDAMTTLRPLRPLSNDERRQLDEHGFVVLEDCMGADLLHELRDRIHGVFDEEGDRAGHEFRTEAHAQRLANLVDKGDVFQRAIVLPRVVECVRHVLGPAVKLSSLNARSADPLSDVPQPLHVDMSAIPDERGYWVCNTVWMLDDFTPENGATRVIPGSHRWGKRPQDVLDDPLAPHPQEVLVLGTAGSIAIMNAHAWHGGTANRTSAPRLAMHAFYCRRDKPQQQYQKQLLRPDVQDRLSPELRDMLALDDPLNDAVSAKVTVRSGFMK
jgi:ectoine hydroxylase-related dioxygenase (phytanoyl-CoA dioxygenase family)